MKIDPTKSKGSPKKKREILPEGTYLVDVDFVERALSRKKGTPYLSFTYVVSAGKSKGKRVYDNVYLLESVMWKIESLVGALGITDEFDTKDQGNLLDTFCDDKSMIVTVKHETSEYVNKDGITVEDTKAVVNNYRATSETKERIAQLKAEAGEEGSPDAMPEGSDSEEVPEDDMPY